VDLVVALEPLQQLSQNLIHGLQPVDMREEFPSIKAYRNVRMCAKEVCGKVESEAPARTAVRTG